MLNVVIIRIIRNVIVAGYVLVSETIKVRIFPCNQDFYCDYCCLLIALYLVRFRLRLECPGSLMSLYPPTFHVTPIDLGIIFLCKLYIYISCVRSSGNKIISNCFNVARSIPAEAALIYIMHEEALRGYCELGWGVRRVN